jgi:hypothetical protein
LSDPVDFDIQRFVTTSRLISDFHPLNSGKFAEATRRQEIQKSKKVLQDTNYIIHGGGTVVSVEADPTNTASAQNTAPTGASQSPPASAESRN